MAATRTPPFFSATDPAVAQMWLDLGVRLHAGDDERMMPLEKEILLAWQQLSLNRPGGYFDLYELSMKANEISGRNRPFSAMRTPTMKRARVLSHAGILRREKAAALGVRRSILFTLRSPREVAEIWEGEPRDSQMARFDGKPLPDKFESNAHVQDLVEATHRHLVTLGYLAPQREAESLAKNEPWTLHLISQLIERCSRPSSREPLDHLEAHIRLGGEPVKVQASRVYHAWQKGHDYGLVTAGDAQLILAIVTLAMQNITQDLAAGHNPPTNRVSFDLRKLSKLLAPGDGGACYRALQKGMARIINTEYVMSPLDDASGRVQRHFRLVEDALEGEDEQAPVDETWVPGTNMRYFSISLNKHLWQSLLKGCGWLVHPDLLYERNGHIHKLYHHLRSHAGLERTYRVHSDDLALIFGVMNSANPPRDRQRFTKALREALVEKARRSMFMMGDEVPRLMHFKLYDLEVSLELDDTLRQGFTIACRLSEETLNLVQQQEARVRELLHHQNLELPGRAEPAGGLGLLEDE